MGIPAYFKKITHKYSNIIQLDIDNVGYLYLDLNCCIHKCCREILDKTPFDMNITKVEELMIDNIIDYIIKLYNYTKPSELLYIAIDGTAPRAKMTQQRIRRFKSKKEHNEINTIKNKYIDINNYKWDTNAITPGTIFMEKLSDTIKSKLLDLKDIKIILSDSNHPGEGEHKIFHYIKNNDNDDQLKHVIYGLDADLIMLSLSCNIENIYLIREELEFNPKESNIKEFLFLDINELSNGIMSDLIDSGLENNNKEINKWDFINDYIVLCFLLGNDFIPHLLSLEIRYDGLTILLENYLTIYNNRQEHLLVKKEYLNFNFLKDLLYILSIHEDRRLTHLTKKILSYNWYPQPHHNTMEKELDKLQNYPLFNREIETNYMLGIGDKWKQNYYNQVLKIDNNQIIELCYNYFQGLIWTIAYYFKNCISNIWYYKYLGGPSISDLLNHIDLLETITFGKNDKITPYEQLLMVLPSSSNHLLPTNYKKLQLDMKSPLLDYYPIDFKLFSYYKRYYWECTPILPNIDLKKIKNSIKNIKLTELEIKRNSETDEYIINL